MDRSKVDSIATLISAIEKQKDLELFNHFRAVQEICNEEQKEHFKSIIKRALKKRGRNGSDRSSRRRDGPAKKN